MPSYVALLRAVNVGGRRQVAMADLRKLCDGLGLENARTVLQSGNLVFRSGVRSARRVEQVLEAEAQRRLALDTDIMVRSAGEWHEAVARNPLRRAAERQPSRFIVMFLKAAPDRGAAERLRAVATGPEQAALVGTQAYLVYPDGFARSRLTIARLEAAFGTRGTGRNWNTVLKLAGLVGQ